MAEKINITCKGSKAVELDKLQEFQGDLKEITSEKMDKLKRVILSHGFSFPVFVWGEFILDGHHRLKAVRELVDAGYSIGSIPVVEIEAKNKTEAGEKLLLLNSQYAEMTDSGFGNFILDMDINIEWLLNGIDLPQVDVSQFIDTLKPGKDIDFQEVEFEEKHKQQMLCACDYSIYKEFLDLLRDFKKKYNDLFTYTNMTGAPTGENANA